jgi:hypothetical protein
LGQSNIKNSALPRHPSFDFELSLIVQAFVNVAVLTATTVEGTAPDYTVAFAANYVEWLKKFSKQLEKI